MSELCIFSLQWSKRFLVFNRCCSNVILSDLPTFAIARINMLMKRKTWFHFDQALQLNAFQANCQIEITHQTAHGSTIVYDSMNVDLQRYRF
jgi:hypothetical protein